MSPLTARNPHDKTTVSEVAGAPESMLTEIDHVAIAVRDLGAAIDYYRETFGALVKGFGVTFRNMFRKTVTENYPFEPVHFQPRYRGIHVLHRDENGLEKCVGCFLCAAACPANCIYIEAAGVHPTHHPAVAVYVLLLDPDLLAEN